MQELIKVETASGTAAATVATSQAVFDLMVGWADRMTHTTGISTMSDVQQAIDDLETGYATSGPSLAELQQAIMLTQTAYSLILNAVLPRVAPQLADELAAASSRAWRGHPDIERLTVLKPTDRCICDRPKARGPSAICPPTSTATTTSRPGFSRRCASSERVRDVRAGRQVRVVGVGRSR